MAYGVLTEPLPVVPSTLDQMLRTDHGHATRFLQRATFGPRPGDVERLQDLGPQAWLDEQMALGADQSLFDEMLGADTKFFPYWMWTSYLTNSAQLRMRVSYALSQIFVISDRIVGPERAAGFVDVLNRHAFGNFRDLLEAVTLSPAMAHYLSNHRNAPENPRTGSMPDENYAREVMQLFTIGLWELNPDGSRVLRDGEPVATYDNEDVMGLARCMTGWETSFENDERRFAEPMTVWEPTLRWHEQREKRFLGTVVPEGTSARETMKIAMDALFHHPNTAPFISKLLIQRLVTSNPSPGYVRGVSSVFDDNGSGVRGDLAAVVRSVLTDPEGFQSTPLAGFGKIREPVLRFAAILRMLDVSGNDVPLRVGDHSGAANGLGQQPLRAPSVFNFFRPGFVPSAGSFDSDGMVSPEMQIVDEVTTIGWVNRLARTLKQSTGGITLDFEDLELLSGDPEALVDEVARRLCPGRLAPETRATAIRALDRTRLEPIELQQRERAIGAVVLLAASTDFIYER